MVFFALYESECLELRDIVSPEFYQFCIDNIATSTATAITSDKQADFFYSSLKSVLDNQGFPLPHPFGSELIYGFEGFEFKDGRNVIILRTDTNEVILVIQKYYYTDQIFFVDRNMMLKLGPLFDEQNRFIADLHEAYLQYENKKPELNYSYALEVSNSRPWHALYPMLGVLNEVNQKFSKEYGSIPIYYVSNKIFIDYSQYFECMETLMTRPNLCVRVEIQMYRRPPYELDQMLLRGAKDTVFSHEVESIIDQQTKGKLYNKPIIWISLAVEKRQLITLLDAMSKFITMMILVFPDTLLIFDGLTPTVDFKTNVASTSFSEDKGVLEKLLNKLLPKKLNYIHSSGFSVMQKMHLADLCDFFISDSGTASMYPGRFAQKAGVIFQPNCWYAIEHEHFNSIAVDQARIYDIYSGKESVNTDFYIEPNYLASFCFYQFLKTKYA